MTINENCSDSECNGKYCYGFNCWDCNFNTMHGNEYYMVEDELWAIATDDCGKCVMLCIGCLENRIGGKLEPDDFPDYPINRGFFDYSARLANRLGLTA